MTRQTQNSMALVGVLAGGIAFVAFVVLLTVGGFAFSPAIFLAVLVGLAVSIFLLRAFHVDAEAPAQQKDKAATRASAPAAAKPAATAAPVAAPAPAPAPAPKAPSPAPVAEGGSKPAGLDGPRGGNPDDLKKIKGVGPKLEQLLQSMGYYHFDQVANWSSDEVAWVDENLEGFKGRVSRDDWVAQARTLAEGGNTEFSKRVDEGDVY